jgi:hypothetical protein
MSYLWCAVPGRVKCLTISDVNAGECCLAVLRLQEKLVLGSRDSGISVFNLADGQNQSDDMESRDITFELCFEYFGTPYCFATPNHEILVYGFVEGDEVCGEVAAVDDAGTQNGQDLHAQWQVAAHQPWTLQ